MERRVSEAHGNRCQTVSEGSVEKNQSPDLTSRNGIGGNLGQTGLNETVKPMSIKDRGRRSGRDKMGASVKF
ncbi:MAG: hypothetical protein ACE5OR_03480 [bacterium]